jgi:hypothetical protein
MNTQKEKWVDAYYFPEKYEVSNFGILRNKLTKKLHKSSQNKDGYYHTSLAQNGNKIYVRTHRLVYLSFYPDTPLHLHIHHLDHDPVNNRLSNLGAMDNRAHNSMHVQMRIMSGNFNLVKGKKHPSFKGTIVALCPKTYEIKYVIVGRHEIESLGFNFSAVYKVVRNELKSYKGLIFKRVNDISDIKIGHIYDINAECQK